jgi:hypothetical protein
MPTELAPVMSKSKGRNNDDKSYGHRASAHDTLDQKAPNIRNLSCKTRGVIS